MRDAREFQPRALGEVAIRCADMAAMVTFYEEVIGLQRLTGGHRDAITFFRISAGFGGHTAALALHQIALSLPCAEQDAVMRWYDRIGQPYLVEQFGWIGWRGIFTHDPAGNTVELVAYDAAMLDAPAE